MRVKGAVRTIFATLLVAFSLGAAAGPIQLVKDINRGVEGTFYHPATLGPKSILPLCVDSGCLPFVTDGTTEGTRALSSTFGSASKIGHFTTVGSLTFFFAPINAAGSVRVWRTDGTFAGTAAIDASVEPQFQWTPVAVDRFLVFVDKNGSLWATDGTQAGTTALASHVRGVDLAATSSSVFFFRYNEGTGDELWTTDGTASGTRLVKVLSPNSFVDAPTAVGERLVFNFGDELWASDGTTAGTGPIAAIGHQVTTPAIVRVGGTAYFARLLEGSSDSQLWRTDGTVAGTSLFATVPGTVQPYLLMPAESLVYFTSYSPSQLWRTDGTPSGTFVLGTGPDFYSIATVGDVAYASTGDGPVLRTDGTAPVSEVPALFGLEPRYALGSRLLLEPYRAWLWDSVQLSPLLVAEGEPSIGSICGDTSKAMATLGAKVLFFADDTVHGCELWSSDLTEAGTTLVKDIFPGRETSGYGRHVVTMGGLAYFSADDGSGLALWKSDGTEAGTAPVRSLSGLDPNSYSSLYELAVVGSTLYFIVGSGFDQVLWRSDGTSAGTLALTGRSSFSSLTPGDGVLYFKDFWGLWKSDGTPAGTVMLREDLAIDDGLVMAGGRVFFMARDDVLQWAIWTSDGTAAGTRGIAAMPLDYSSYLGGTGIFGAVGGRAVFGANTGPADAPEAWATDGTVEGTVRISSSGGGILQGSQMVGDTLYFGDPFGAVLATDGTPAGTRLVAAGLSYCCAFSSVLPSNPGAIYFIGYDSTNGYELRVTSAEAGGAHLIEDHSPGTSGSGDLRLVMVGEKPFITVKDRRFGAEPHILAIDAPPALLVFPAQTGLAMGVAAISAPQQVLGIVAPAHVAATNGQVCVSAGANCACDVAPFGVSASVSPGQSLCVRHITAAQPLTTVTTTVAVGTATAQFSSTTAAAAKSAISFSAAAYRVTEDGQVEVMVERQGPTAGAVTVHWTTENGSAVAGSDFGTAGNAAQVSGTLSWATGDSTARRILVGSSRGQVPLISSSAIEAEETFSIRLLAPAGSAVLGATPLAQVTIVDVSANVQFQETTFYVGETGANVILRAIRTGALDREMSVAWQSQPGSALAGSDFGPPGEPAPGGTLTFAPGDSQKIVTVGPAPAPAPYIQVRADAFPETSESFTVRLSAPSTGLTLGPSDTATVNIASLEPGVAMVAPVVTVDEAAGVAYVDVRLVGNVGNYASVDYATSNGTALAGTHYTATSGSLFLSPLQTLPARIAIPIIDNGAANTTRSFTVTLSNPSAGITLGNASTRVDIADNETSGTLTLAQAQYSVNESAGNVTLRVRRLGPASAAASVVWTTANGSATSGQDYGVTGNAVPRTGTLIWAAGNATDKTIVIPILQDTVVEGSGTFAVTLSNPSSGMHLGAISTATITITDDDIPLESIISFSQPKYLVMESDGSAAITLHREPINGGFTTSATVNYATVPGTALATSDYTTRSGSVTWTGTDPTDKTISIPIVNNTVAEGHESFTVTLTTTSPGALVDTPQATVTIVDDDDAFPKYGVVPDGWIVPAAATKGWHASSDAGAYEGVFSLRSDAIGDGETSQVEVTRTLAAGSITFRAKVSSEAGFDVLRFFVDGVEKASWSGTTITGWQMASIPVTSGSHTLRWSYEKDSTASVGYDAAWIDGVVLP